MQQHTGEGGICCFAYGGCGWVGFVGIGAVMHVLNKLKSAESGSGRARGTPDAYNAAYCGFGSQYTQLKKSLNLICVRVQRVLNP